jgi:hypothetical protein
MLDHGVCHRLPLPSEEGRANALGRRPALAQVWTVRDVAPGIRAAASVGVVQSGG